MARRKHEPVCPGVQPTVASGVWVEANRFVLTVRLYETPYVQTLSFRFMEGQVDIDVTVNVSFGPNEIASLTGQQESE